VIFIKKVGNKVGKNKNREENFDMSEIIGASLFLIGLFLGYQWGKESYRTKIITAILSWEDRNKIPGQKKDTLKEWLIKYLALKILSHP
jgi:hypothetical protein